MSGEQEPEMVRVSLEQVELVIPLFDAYRQFYEQAPNLAGARQFLTQRLQREESVIFVALVQGQPVGFTQLYPSFSSMSMMPIWILNDLFVAPQARRHGVGKRLLAAAREHARRSGAIRLALSTGVTNTTAQALYERDGWQRDQAFYHYEYALPRNEE